MDFIIALLFDLVVTAALFLIIPLIIRMKCGRIRQRNARIVAVINAILVEAFFTIALYFIGVPSFNFSPAIFWGIISYYLMRSKYF